MSESVKVGRLIEGAEERDAIHIAVAPVTAAETLYPGQRVGFTQEGDTERVGLTDRLATVGIVDPFLTGAVYPGQRFFLFLFPQAITSLRHQWTHPAWPEGGGPPALSDAVVQAARARIQDLADDLRLSYDALMTGARDYQQRGEYLRELGSDTWRDIFDPQREQFWRDYETVTGEVARDRDNFFTCSC